MRARLAVFCALAALPCAPISAEPFAWEPPGVLVPGSGTGNTDPTVFAPDIRFPLEDAPAYANSQVYGRGGMHGPNGSGQCETPNYSFPWRDNFCESRSYVTGACPLGRGHQGQDIRPKTCKKDVHWVVAVEDGVIENIGSYSVLLHADSNISYQYLHMKMDALMVRLGDQVTKGQRIGLVSNHFTAPTTIHLHFEILLNSASQGKQPVSPYMSLVRSFERLLTENPNSGAPSGGTTPAGSEASGSTAPGSTGSTGSSSSGSTASNTPRPRESSESEVPIFTQPNPEIRTE
jgi:hypothetical protein